MSEAKTSGKAGRPSRTLEQEIAATEARLKALREKQKEADRRERERNQKAILALIRDEGLDDIPAENWRTALPKLRELLKVKGDAAPKKAQPAAEPQPVVAAA